MKHFFSVGCSGLLAALWLLAGPVVRAQAPAWAQLSTGVPVSTDAFSYVMASTADAAGNVYLAGHFYGSVGFGSTVLASTSATLPDGFVAKWNPTTGTFVWAVAMGGTNNDQASALAVGNGAVYVSGHFTSVTAQFGPLSLSNSQTNGTGDVFLAKLVDAGPTASFVWAQQLGGPGADLASSLAVSGSAVYLAGFFRGASLTVGSTVLPNANPGLPATADAFVARWNDAGPTASLAWAQGFGGPGADEPRALAASGSSLYLVGDFASPTLALGSTTLTNAAPGTADVFITKLTDSGSAATVAWAQRAGSPGADTGDALALQGSSLYVAGSYEGTTATVGAVLLPNSGPAGTTDVFVAKLLDAGTSATVAWGQAGGGPGNDRPRALAPRGSVVCVAGSYDYPRATFGATTLANRGTGQTTDIFVAKLAEAGTGAAFAWAQSAGGPGGDTAFGLSLVGSRVVATGGAAPQAFFGTLAAPATSANNTAFVATLLDATLPAAATAPALAGTAFGVAPNPAHARTTVQLPALPGVATATLVLRDALGRTVCTATVLLPPTGLRHDLDLTGLAPGIYALHVRAGEATATRRLVVE